MSFGGSGNMVTKMRANLDDFVYAKTPQGSPLDATHQCMVSTMIDSQKNKTGRAEIETFYNQCKSKIAASSNGVDALFLPVEFYTYKANILVALKNAIAVDMAVQEFGDNDIRDALIEVQKRGGLVRNITNDRWYYVAQNKKNIGIYKFYVYKKYYMPLISAGIQVKFLETNSDLDIRNNNFMHLRYMVVYEPTKTTVFTGASHVKTGAFKNNFENQYVITNAKLVDEYSTHFAALWPRGLAWSDMPRKHEITKYAAEQQGSKPNMIKEMQETP